MKFRVVLFFMTLVLIAEPMLLSAAINVEDGYSQIKGTIAVERLNVIKLYKVVHGKPEELASIVPETNGSFGFLFQPAYKGFYMISCGSNYSSSEKCIFYLEGNDHLNIAINDAGYSLVDRNTAENEILSEWRHHRDLIRQNLRGESQTKDDFNVFLQRIETLKEYNKYFLKKISLKNINFNYLLKNLLKYEPVMLVAQRASLQENEEVLRKHSFFRMSALAAYMENEDLLTLPFGQELMFKLLFINSMLAGKKLAKDDLNDSFALVPSKILKGVLLLEATVGIENYQILNQYMEKYGAYLVEPWQKQQMLAKISAKSEFAQGKPAIDFTFPDRNGKNISLSSFKDKLILVDVWATWCGPCKKEFPALNELEKRYKDKNIVFMSVSVDDKIDVWREFIEREEAAGIQLFAGGINNLMSKLYKITTIPRFMLFDKNGMIITTEAPRPSSKKLEGLIDQWLEQ